MKLLMMCRVSSVQSYNFMKEVFMLKVLYLIERIVKLDYANMLRISKSVSRKAKKSQGYILYDMIKCGIKYQAGYYDYQEFEFYNISEDKRNTFLTRGKNNEIIKKYNDRKHFDVFNDKIKFNKVFSGYLGREWMDLKTSSLDDFIGFIEKNPIIIAKPIDGECGNGIEKYVLSESGSAEEIYRSVISKKQLLVEAFVRQHKDMDILYAGSVNTIRMFTFCKEGRGHFLQAILKIGNGGVIDNFSSGGMYTFVEDDGTVEVPAIDKNDVIYERHPITNTGIVGFNVPMFAQAVRLVEKAAQTVPEIGYVGWDVAIGENGPIIIEGNCFPGVFQKKAGFAKNGTGILPKYSRYMDI